MAKFDLVPANRPDAAWQDLPPDPMQDPALYDGMIPRRIMGFIMDWVLLIVIFGVLWVVLGLLTVITFGLFGPIQVFILVALPVLYNWVLIARQGATIGMRLNDVEIRSFDGSVPDAVQALIFAVVYYITVPTTSGLVLLFVFFNDRRRTLHDLLSGTVAVRASRLQGSPPG